MIKRWAVVLINVVLLVVAVVVYPRLPDQLPTHWDMHGDVNGTMPKFPGAFLPSLISLAVLFLLPMLRKIDPRRASYERMEPTFYLVINLVALLMVMIEALTLAVGLGFDIDMLRAMLFGLGLMFALLGNYMPRLKSNWWMGIRTPWTLDNEEVWRRTHRFAGRAFVAAGVITMLATMLPREAASMLAFTSLILAGLLPVVYSYIVWRAERKVGSDA